MCVTITGLVARDIRFPTSRSLDGSDAMHPDPDYSAAYVILKTDSPDGLEGHGLTFTIGRGNEVCISAIHALEFHVLGRTLEALYRDMRSFCRTLTNDGQLRWIGPEKGVIHLATAAIVNAVWDLLAKSKGKPLWKLLTDMSSEQLVALVDFQYITDALRPEEALDILRSGEVGRSTRETEMRSRGFPAYTTSTGWLGYSEEKLQDLCRKALAEGWSNFKMKVGADIGEDRRRAALFRDEIGGDRKLMMDANQRWDVAEAISNMKRLAEFDPWWIEEPTSPDDILGHASIARAISPIAVATGEQCQNRVMFKQLFQADAIGFCQLDNCRLAGINEALAVLLMAVKFGIPVCPHAGGVGLSQYAQHLAMFDYIRLSGSLENRLIEYTEHLHEHFEEPLLVEQGCYMPPTNPGYSVTIRQKSLEEFEFPNGIAWKDKF